MDRVRGTQSLITHFYCTNACNTQPGMQDLQDVQEHNTGCGYDSRQSTYVWGSPCPSPHNQSEASGKSEQKENGIKKLNFKRTGTLS